MKATVADHLLARLRDWGVEHVFGYPGDGINGLLGAFSRADDHPRFIQSRHEEMSAFAAVGLREVHRSARRLHGHVRARRIHLLNGLYDAKLDHVPVVAIVGQTNRSAMGGSYQQEVDLLSLFKDVASDYVQTVNVPEQLPNVLDRAIRIAMTPAGADGRHHPQRRAGPRLRPAQPRVQDGALEPRHHLAERSAPTRQRCARGRRPQRGLQGRHPGRPGRARGGRRDPARSSTCWAPAWPRHCSARTSSATSCRG